jgi:aminoglycoside phosphotransferase (APT) family kinase protein
MTQAGRSEPAIDRVLRRADWRFLTSRTYFERAACAAGGSLRDALSAISAAVVDPARPVDDCDLFVATNPSGDALDEGRRRLRVGACCYTEWSAGTDNAARALRLLEGCGFRDVELYRPWPSADEAQVWFPVANPKLSSWFFARQVRTADGMLRRLVRLGRHFAFYAGQRHGAATVAAIAHNLPREQDADAGFSLSLPSLLTTIRQRWSEWGLGPQPARVWTVMHTAGPRSINKVIIFVFADAECEPRLVVKAARTANATIGLRRESEILLALHDVLDGGPGGIPQVLFQRGDSGSALVCQTALPGESVTPGVVAREYRQCAEAAIEWLIQFGRCTRHPSDMSPWNDIAAAALNTFIRNYRDVLSDGLPDRIARMVRHAQPPPSVCEHRDFSPWNLLTDGRQRLSVVDWESSEPNGIAGTDPIYYLTHLAFYRHGLLGKRSRASIDAFVRAYQQAWHTGHVVGRVNHACMSAYMTALGIDGATLPALRVVTWLIHSASEHARLTSTTSPQHHDALRGGLFLNLLESECATALTSSLP